MNKLNRRLLSGASLAALALTVPTAEANAAFVCRGGGSQSVVCSSTPAVTAVGTGGTGVVTVHDTGVIIANAIGSSTTPLTARAVVMTAHNAGGFAENTVTNPAGGTIGAVAINARSFE